MPPANTTQTIAAPLRFYGRDVPLKGDLTPEDFLRELEGRIAGQELTTDATKIAFTAQCMIGEAYAFFKGLDGDDEYVATFASFKQRFRHYYQLPGASIDNFDCSKLHAQRIDESPHHYLNRVRLYVTSSFPASHFCQFFADTQTSFDAAVLDQFGPDTTNDTKRAIKRVVAVTMATNLEKHYQAFWLRYIWTQGLMRPYREIAALQDSKLTLTQIVIKVTKAGGNTIQLSRFNSHTEAMQAYNKRKGLKNNGVVLTPVNGSTTAKICEIIDEDGFEEEADVDAVQSRSARKCSYCKRPGHVEKKCKKKVNDEKRTGNGSRSSSDSNGKGKGNSSSNHAHADIQSTLDSLLTQVSALTAKDKQRDAAAAAVSHVSAISAPPSPDF